MACLIACLAAASASAGGGPENVFLVVNPQSADSKTIANYYVQIRQIPPSNVFYLPWEAKNESIGVDEFRTTILKPILDAIQSRRLTGQIDYVVYSADFPWTVSLDSDVAKLKEGHFPAGPPTGDLPAGKGEKSIPTNLPGAWPVGSLNGLTYLWHAVMQTPPTYFDLLGNRYMRLPIEAQKDKPTLGFRSSWQFGPQGEVVEKNGSSYLLSTMLAVTSGGNSVAAVLKYLERSAKADGTHPRGTIYFMKNDDVRSTVRDKFFPEVVGDLKKLGIE